MVQERRGGQRNVKFLDAGRARRLGKIEARGSLLLADEGVSQALWRSAFGIHSARAQRHARVELGALDAEVALHVAHVGVLREEALHQRGIGRD